MSKRYIRYVRAFMISVGVLLLTAGLYILFVMLPRGDDANASIMVVMSLAISAGVFLIAGSLLLLRGITGSGWLLTTMRNDAEHGLLTPERAAELRARIRDGQQP